MSCLYWCVQVSRAARQALPSAWAAEDNRCRPCPATAQPSLQPFISAEHPSPRMCLQLLSLGDAAVLTFLAPVFVAAAAPLVLGERASKGVLLALPLCAAGVLLVAEPPFLFGEAAAALSTLGVAVGIAQVSQGPGGFKTAGSGAGPRATRLYRCIARTELCSIPYSHNWRMLLQQGACLHANRRLMPVPSGARPSPCTCTHAYCYASIPCAGRVLRCRQALHPQPGRN